MNENNTTLIIAANVFDESKSIILLEDVSEKFSEEDLQIDLSEFVGKGMVVGAFSPVDTIESDGETYVTLEYDGRRQAFVCFDYFGNFPLIEGDLVPGIYLLEERSGHYFALHNDDDLSAAFNELEEYYEIDKFKFVCSPEKIIWQWLEASRSAIDFERYPFSYFDLYCPVCETKILGYETKDASPTCVFTKHRCPHYAGAAFYDEYDEMYEKAGLARLNFNYKFVGNELYLESSHGDWEKPIIVEYKPGDDSFHAGDPDDGGTEHFLFLTETDVKEN